MVVVYSGFVKIKTPIAKASAPNVVPMICYLGLPPIFETTNGIIPHITAGINAITMFIFIPPNSSAYGLYPFPHEIIPIPVIIC